MDMLVGYGGVVLLFVAVVVAMERSRVRSDDFSDYATAGRSFGSFYSTMAFVNTWLPGTIFISFAGLAASSGVIGFYVVSYSLLAVVLMFFLARPVNVWGRTFDLRTQADLLGLRYGSRAVRVLAALIGIVATVPWVVLGLQSLALVFTYLSFGRVTGVAAVVIGIAVLALRQIWTVRHGMRGVIVSDMVQGVVAYFVGTVVLVGLLTWLVTNGHGLAAADDAMFTLPGPGSELGPLYLMSIVLTGGLGGWCWPDIFVRLFTSRSAATIQRSALQAAPILLVFGSALFLTVICASTYPGVAGAPDDVWLITAGIGGVGLVTLAGVCVVAATMGNVGANLQALGTQTANDVVGAFRAERVEDARSGKWWVVAFTVVAAIGALALSGGSTGLIALALVSYQAIVQLAPAVLLGIFWRRGNATGAACGMVGGIAVAAVLQVLYPTSVPWLGGLTSGVAGLLVNASVYVACAYLLPAAEDEQDRVDAMFAALSSGAGDPMIDELPEAAR